MIPSAIVPPAVAQRPNPRQVSRIYPRERPVEADEDGLGYVRVPILVFECGCEVEIEAEALPQIERGSWGWCAGACLQ